MLRYSFRPTLIPTLATLILLPCLIALGFWQLDRAEQRRQLLATYAARLQQPPVNIDEINPDDKTIDYTAVKVRGEYLNQFQILLENKFYHHLLGYQILTPLLVKATGKVILINRGWIPRGEVRQYLPRIPAITGEITITGFVKIPERNPFAINHHYEKTDKWPRRVPLVNIKQLSQQLGMDLYPFVILLAQDQPHGFEREWQPVGVKPERHIGYAVQWFALALLLVIIYITVNLKRRDERAE